jgi:molybdopterin adenylyltransferase
MFYNPERLSMLILRLPIEIFSMKIHAISISPRKGTRKTNVDSANLLENLGLENDAHGGKWHRQVSFLAQESIDTMRDKGLDVVAGNFAENITTIGIDLLSLPIGSHLEVGASEVVISQIGKVCHHKCAIFHQAGDCVMPREGIFGVVIRGGMIHVGDPIRITGGHSPSAGIIGTAAVEKESGERLKKLLLSLWNPAFIRFDRLNDKEDNMQEILNDVIELQRIDHVLIFDPTGRHKLVMLDIGAKAAGGGRYQKGKTTIHYCRTLEEVEREI